MHKTMKDESLEVEPIFLSLLIPNLNFFLDLCVLMLENYSPTFTY